MVEIVDNLVNLVSGLGTSRDKHTYSEFKKVVLSQTELDTLYQNWIFGKVVDIPADDMTRKWRRPACPSLTPDQIDQFIKAEEDLDVRGAFNSAVKWARLYGGSVIIIGAEDQGTNGLADPLNPRSVARGGLVSLTVMDRWDISTQSVERTPGPGFGLPSMYYINGGTAVHPSRVIRFDGIKLPCREFERNQYWGGSVCNRVYADALSASTASQSVASMIYEASIEVIGVKDLFSRLMDKNKLGALLKRFEIATLTKSINKTLIIDKDNEDYAKYPTQFAGLSDLISELLSLVCSASDIPATRFLGQSAKGLNATGEGDLKNYYDMISGQQETCLAKQLNQLDQVLVRSVLGDMPTDWGYEFNSLWQMSDIEVATMEKTKAETAAIHMTNGVILPSHVAGQLLVSAVYPSLDGDYVNSMEAIEGTTEGTTAADDNADDMAPQPTADQPLDTTTNVQAQVLNGAQVASLVDISAQVKAGTLDVDAAVAIIMTAIPSIRELDARRIAGAYNPSAAPIPDPIFGGA